MIGYVPLSTTHLILVAVTSLIVSIIIMVFINIGCYNIGNETNNKLFKITKPQAKEILHEKPVMIYSLFATIALAGLLFSWYMSIARLIVC